MCRKPSAPCSVWRQREKSNERILRLAAVEPDGSACFLSAGPPLAIDSDRGAGAAAHVSISIESSESSILDLVRSGGEVPASLLSVDGIRPSARVAERTDHTKSNFLGGGDEQGLHAGHSLRSARDVPHDGGTGAGRAVGVGRLILFVVLRIRRGDLCVVAAMVSSERSNPAIEGSRRGPARRDSAWS